MYILIRSERVRRSRTASSGRAVPVAMAMALSAMALAVKVLPGRTGLDLSAHHTLLTVVFWGLIVCTVTAWALVAMQAVSAQRDRW